MSTKKRLRLRQIRSSIGYRHDQRETLRGLRLGGPGRTSELEDTASVRGMIQKVKHLVRVEEEA